MERKSDYDVIVVGTGAGGSTVAYELSKKGLKVLVLEKGEVQEQGKAAVHIKTKPITLTFEEENLREHEFFNQPAELMYMEGLGGTTPVSLANACYACTSCYKNSATSQFKVHDIELFQELLEASSELNVASVPIEMMGRATLNTMKQGEKLGHFMEPMPKFIDFDKCDICGSCINGCMKNAKWDGNFFIKKIRSHPNTEIITNFTVTSVLYDSNKVRGVEGFDHDGNFVTYNSSRIVLSAGALNTPIILLNSNINSDVGSGFFTDFFITVGGYLKDVGLNKEIPMGVKSEFGPYFISPHYSGQLIPLIKNKGYDTRPEDVMGLMVKIADDANGRILPTGEVQKKITLKDIELLNEGYMKCLEILNALGVDPLSISTTAVRGAHPGGTAAIGKVVDKNLETAVKGLYVADSSVIPQAPGRPPILTVIALGKKLSKHILSELNNDHV